MKILQKHLKKLSLLFVFLVAPLLLSACSLSFSGSGSTGVDSSVFLSIDGGNTWREATAMASPSQPQTIKSLNVNTMTFDPQDSLAVYLASFNEGLYYTYNIVESGWSKVKGLPSATITAVQVDPKNKCTIYAATANLLYRSNDCSRTWKQVYYDNNTEVTINTIAVDHYNPRNIYVGTSRGEIIKSIDSGDSWRTIQRFEEGISQLTISPADSRLIFVASQKNRIFSFYSNTNTDSVDSADIEKNFVINNWTDLNTVLKEYDLGKTFRNFVVCAKDGKMFISTNQLILRSGDNGITWERINLIQPEKEAVINAMTVDPQNSNNLFYVTNTTFFRSTDGGTSWSTKKLPTNRAGRSLLVDFTNPNYIYLGTMQIK